MRHYIRFVKKKWVFMSCEKRRAEKGRNIQSIKDLVKGDLWAHAMPPIDTKNEIALVPDSLCTMSSAVFPVSLKRKVYILKR